jgi:small redox-active disulfide protein 1
MNIVGDIMKIEVFTSPSCPYCPMAVGVARKIAKEKKAKLEEIDIMVDKTKAVEYGLMAVPAIAVDGVIKFVGAPTEEELKKAIPL